MTKKQIEYAWEGMELYISDDTDGVFLAAVKLITKVRADCWRVEFDGGLQVDCNIRTLRFKNIEDSYKISKIINRENILNELL